MSFIPGFHFVSAAEKLKPKFCNDAVHFYYFNSGLVPLLGKKDVIEIESYAAGDYDMTQFKRMYRSYRQRSHLNQGERLLDKKWNIENCGIDWSQVALIPPKLNAAVAITQKQPFDITVTCQDALAQKKKAQDMQFLKNKPMMEAELQPLYDKMQLGKVDMGATEHSAVPFTELPMDLDMDDPQDFKVFADIIYNLAPESAFETVLEEIKEQKKLEQLRYLEAMDQYKFGVSVNRCILDKVTALPSIEYVHPSEVWVTPSRLRDYADTPFRCIDKRLTPIELMNYFPDEIPNMEALNKIVNGKASKFDGFAQKGGYCECNNASFLTVSDFNTYKMTLKYCEVRTPDSITIVTKKNKTGNYQYITDDPKIEGEKVWGTNTIGFYWLFNTDMFFGIDRLPYAFRTKGKEILSPFSINIFRSQVKSAVEHCIGENKKAQIADIKLQHELLEAKPDGYAVNIKDIRRAVDSMVKDPENPEYSITELLTAGNERNVWVYETEDYEGRQGAPAPPVSRIPGGPSAAIQQYYIARQQADAAVSRYTGINDQLTGQTPSPDMLIGLQKLLVNASINAINYVPEALLAQYKPAFNIWANYIQQIIKDGGPQKQAIEQIIGSRKVELIKGLNEIPLHQMGIKITLGQREEEKQEMRNNIMALKQKGALNTFDEWMINAVLNPKDAMLLIAVKEAKFAKKQEQQQQAMLANQQQIAQQQGQNMLQNTQAQTQGKIQTIQASGQVESQLLQLSAQLNLTQAQQDMLLALKLQQDRNQGQTDKGLQTIGAKANLDNQKPFASAQ